MCEAASLDRRTLLLSGHIATTDGAAPVDRRNAAEASDDFVGVDAAGIAAADFPFAVGALADHLVYERVNGGAALGRKR